jgi:hypothetical protein
VQWIDDLKGDKVGFSYGELIFIARPAAAV